MRRRSAPTQAEGLVMVSLSIPLCSPPLLSFGFSTPSLQTNNSFVLIAGRAETTYCIPIYGVLYLWPTNRSENNARENRCLAGHTGTDGAQDTRSHGATAWLWNRTSY